MSALLLVFLSLLPIAQSSESCDKLLATMDGPKSKIKKVLAESNCSFLYAPEATTLGGEWCVSIVSSAGFYRAVEMNPLLGNVLPFFGKDIPPPIMTSSANGGSLFATRFFTMKSAAGAKWAYPCYLLTPDLRTMCYFHGAFGRVAEVCESDTYSITAATAYLTLGPLMMSYGGPLGVTVVYQTIKFPFMYDLPIEKGGITFARLAPKLMMWNTGQRRYESWGPSMSQANPGGAGALVMSLIPSYGFESSIHRAFTPISSLGQPEGLTWYSNYSVYKVVVISANSISSMVLAPFALTPEKGPFAFVVIVMSYISVTKLMSMNTLPSSTDPPGCSKIKCVLLGGQFTDSTSVTSSLAYISKVPARARPSQIFLSAGSSAFETIGFLLGKGPISMAPLSVCPFQPASICTLMKTAVKSMGTEVSAEMYALEDAYKIYKPQAQAMTPYCGDPILFDRFQGSCAADGMCNMVVNAIAGKHTGIGYMIESPAFSLTVVWMSHTSLSSRFVKEYIPAQMMKMDYYSSMEDWFPEFSPGGYTGGVAFTKNAGHALMDYMTYLAMRLFLEIVHTKVLAFGLFRGMHPACGYDVYSKVSGSLIKK